MACLIELYNKQLKTREYLELQKLQQLSVPALHTTFFVGSNPPANPQSGTIWLNPSIGNSLLKFWDINSMKWQTVVVDTLDTTIPA